MEIQELNEKLYERNFKKYGFDMNLFVSIVSAVLVLGFIIFTITMPDQSSAFFDSTKDYINTVLVGYLSLQ